MNAQHKKIGYALLRITMGINIITHGGVRIPKIPVFRSWMIEQFEKTILPPWSVYAWASVLPFLEFAIGILLVLGLFTYRAGIAGALLIAILIFGSCLAENWEWAGGQMLYALFFYFIISNEDQNTLALDNIILKKHQAKNNESNRIQNIAATYRSR